MLMVKDVEEREMATAACHESSRQASTSHVPT